MEYPQQEQAGKKTNRHVYRKDQPGSKEGYQEIFPALQVPGGKGKFQPGEDEESAQNAVRETLERD